MINYHKWSINNPSAPFWVPVLILLLIGIPTTSRADEVFCRSSNLGEIRLGDGSMIPAVSGITLRGPGDIYLVSDRKRLLYHARRSGSGWSVDSYGINSEGSEPNKVRIIDIEDVAYGPCPIRSEGQCIFIGEIGGNRGLFTDGKKKFKIHYIRERDLAGNRGRYVTTSLIQYQYPGGGEFDAEGLAVHPRTGEIFVVTKTRGSSSYIYKMDPRFPTRAPTMVIELDLAALFESFGTNTNVRQITGLAISPDGSRFAIVTYEALMEFGFDLARLNNRKLPDDFNNKAIKGRKLYGDWWGAGRDITRVQVESITYNGNDLAFLIIGEGDPTVMALDCSKRTELPRTTAEPIPPASNQPTPEDDCVMEYGPGFYFGRCR